MTKQEWKEIVKEIYNQSIRQKLHIHFRKFHPFEICHEYPYDIYRLIKALRVLKFIEENFDEDKILTTVFAKEYLQSLINDMEAGLSLNNRLVLDSGVADVIEEYFDEITSYMDVEDIPEQDLEALSQAGSRNPKAEIQLSMFKIKHNKETIINRKSNHSLIYTMKESYEIIKNKGKEIERSNEDKPIRRKLFKGIGSIAKGTLLTTIDATLICGVWAPIPLSVEATSVGAVVSITTGIGDIFNGVGEIRGE